MPPDLNTPMISLREHYKKNWLIKDYQIANHLVFYSLNKATIVPYLSSLYIISQTQKDMIKC